MLVLQRQAKYVEDIIVIRDTEKLGMSSNEVIQTISDIKWTSYYDQAENQLDHLIWEKRLPDLKRHGQVIKFQATTTKRSQICVSHQ